MSENNMNDQDKMGNSAGSQTGTSTGSQTGGSAGNPSGNFDGFQGQPNRRSRYARGDEYCKNEGSGLVPGLILIAIGVLWLLDKFSYVNFSLSNLIGSFIDLWPLVLVVAGVNLVFKRYRIVHSISWIVFLGILLSYSIFGPSLFGDQFKMFNDQTFQFEMPDQRSSSNADSQGRFGIESKNYAMQDYTPTVKTGDFELNLGAGDIQIGSDNDNLVSYVIPENVMDQKDVTTNGENAKLIFSQKHNMPSNMHNNGNYDFYLNKDVTWHLQINTGAIDGKFDLENVKLDKLEVNSGASDLDLRLGDLQDHASISINSAASNINLELPESSGIRVTVNGIGGNESLEDAGLVKRGDAYESQDYGNATNKIEVEINTPFSDLELKRY